MRFSCLLIVAILAITPAFVFADDIKPSEKVTLKVDAAAEARPALKYSLWLASRERQPGNGSTYYYRAMLMYQEGRAARDKEFPPEKVASWLTVPILEFPADSAALYLQRSRGMFAELQTATSRETCKWDLRLDQLKGTELMSFLLPDLQLMRDLSRIVACKARYEISQHHYDDAIETLRMGYQMAHDTAEQPLLINALVGVAIANQMSNVTLDLIDAPGSPNLYWAIKQLPQPLVDCRPAFQFEAQSPLQMFPFLQDAETVRRTPGEWQRVTQETITGLNQLSSEFTQTKLDDWQLRLGVTAMMLKAYPIAKQQLIKQGMDQDSVDKMPVAQVIAIQASRNYRYTYDEMFKWTMLPFPEAYQGLRRTNERLKAEGYIGQPFSEKDVMPLASVLLPAVDAVMLASGRYDRRQASLETLEAIRMYAAAHEGKLPASLDELTTTPAPKNPLTGRTFDYRNEDGQAVLDERAPGIDPIRAQDRVYLIELTKQK